MASAATVDYAYLRQIVHAHSQNVLDPSRDYLFDTRLSRVLRAQGMTHLEELVQFLRVRRNPELERTVAEAMTINETSFFRDGRPFELLRTELLPKIIQARQLSRQLRFWSAACSTGQEACSLAMLVREHFPQCDSWNIRIEGTDLSSEVVDRAQSATYQRIEMNRGLPARFVVRYFDHIGEDWIAKPEIRQMCNFRKANLCFPPLPFTERFDVIFLRNVMLYFSQETRKALLAGIHRLLAPDGVLFLGSTEQPADPSIWKAVLSGGTCHFTPVQR
ncbi:MAG: protein-glutamate O-methyltransferase CheR [Acidobacteriota bacterium]|nr:protein-glutamate O-methyltransferase CheR [Acidobacteriota bacterium]